MPVPICRFVRASYARRLRDCAAYGHDEVARQKFLGLRAHLVVCWPGVITDLELAAANVAKLPIAEHHLDGHQGWGPQRLESQPARSLAPTGAAPVAPFRLKHKESSLLAAVAQTHRLPYRNRLWSVGRPLRCQAGQNS